MGREVNERWRAAGLRRPGPGLVLGLITLLCGASAAAVPELVPVLARARTEIEAGKPAEAAHVLLGLTEGELGDHAALLRARLLRESGDLEGALAASQAGLELDPPSEVRARLLQEQARTQIERGALLEAYRAQRAAKEATRDRALAATLLLELAEAFEAAARPGDALQLYNEVWERYPLAEGSAEAFRRARFLAEATGAPPVPAKTLLKYADSLREAQRCDAALGAYARLQGRENLDTRSQERATRGRAHCLFQRRRYAEAADAYVELAGQHPDDRELAVLVARTRARMGERRRAARALETIAAEAGPLLRARTQYLEAILLLRLDPARAKRLLQRVEKQRAAPGLARRATWRLAWADVEAGRHPQAAKRLGRLARGGLDDIEVQRARYWLAMTRLESDPAAARALLTELVEAYPLSYYGLVSARHLEETAPVERPLLGERNGAGEDRAVRRATWLVEGGFPEQARDELESRLHGGRLSRELRLAAGALLHASGAHYRALRLVVDGFGSTLEQGIDPGWRDVWRLAWPRPYPGVVHSAVAEFEGDPALIYAVMREESAYRPAVESPAGARGLMQIIPPTGRSIASALGVESFDPEHLFYPEVNVRFGTYYLKSLLGQFAGEPPLAIAAYNAGPEAVNGWLSAEEKFVQDAWIEAVPYGETRRYLRRVLRSYRMYRLLYGAEIGPPSAESAQSGSDAGR